MSSDWRKSSYSGGDTGSCVEVGTWRKSSYSGGNTGSCVEVAAAGAVLIRDTTQHGTGPVVTIPAVAWTAFLTAIR
jgi:hypothetical protein